MVERPGAKNAKIIGDIAARLNPIAAEQIAPPGEVRPDDEIITMVPMDQIKAVMNVRKTYTEESIEEMSASLKEHGLIQAITVYLRGPEDHVVCYGHRRYFGARKAGFTKIKAHVLSEPPREMIAIQLVENIQREDLNPIEIGAALYDLSLSRNNREIAKLLGKKEDWVSRNLTAHTMRQKYSETLKKYNAENVSANVLCEIAGLPEEEQGVALEQSLSAGGTRKDFREAAKKVKEAQPDPARQKAPEKPSAEESIFMLKITSTKNGLIISPTEKGAFPESVKNAILESCQKIIASLEGDKA
jgi:ParB family chromosome partitioning protein